MDVKSYFTNDLFVQMQLPAALIMVWTLFFRDTCLTIIQKIAFSYHARPLLLDLANNRVQIRLFRLQEKCLKKILF
jgi:hypothetical protein